MNYLKFIINENDVVMKHAKVVTIKNWSIPMSFHDVQVFLGFVNFYKPFIEVYSKIAVGFIALLKGSNKGKFTEKFVWTLNAEKTFKALKKKFMKKSLLRHFDFNWKMKIKTNVSKFVFSTILTQLYINQWHSIVY